MDWKRTLRLLSTDCSKTWLSLSRSSQVRGREAARGQQGGHGGGAGAAAGQDHGAVPLHPRQGRLRGLLQEGVFVDKCIFCRISTLFTQYICLLSFQSAN